MKRFFVTLLGVGVIVIALAACASANPNNAPQAIEAYFKALVAKDVDGVINAACAQWEDEAKMEVDSFGAVAPTLEGLSCSLSSTDGQTTLVACQGVIKATYNNEQQELPLEGRTYVAVLDGGEWRMCGYK